jgi:surfactin synthase thioesterase subunit
MYVMRDLAQQLVATGEQAFLLQYPGRGPRLREPGAGSLAQLARDLAADIQQYAEGGLVLAGHSLGAYISFELAHLFEEAGQDVELLVISAARSPQAGVPQLADVAAMTDEEWIQMLVAQDLSGGEILDSPELLRIAIRTLRSDFQLLAGHPTRTSPLSCPVLIVGGDADPDVAAGHLRGWEELTTGPAATVLLPGDHFYHRDRTAELCDAIRAQQSSVAARAAGHGPLPS